MKTALQHLRKKLLPLGLSLGLLLAGGFAWLNQPTAVSANISDYTLAENTYATIPGSRIDNCSLCHTSVPSLNPYGAAYSNGGRGQASSLTNINNVDSDGDGFSNLQEITAHTYPGDALDFPMTPSATPTTVPTATATTAPSATATATTVPTATQPNPTATAVNPTATAVGPTATLVGPTATKPAVTATKTGTAATKTKPAVTATTKPTKISGTPTVRPTPVKQCVKDDDDYREREKERDRKEGGRKRPNPCPPNYHDREDSIKPRERESSNANFFGQILNAITSLFSGNRTP